MTIDDRAAQTKESTKWGYGVFQLLLWGSLQIGELMQNKQALVPIGLVYSILKETMALSMVFGGQVLVIALVVITTSCPAEKLEIAMRLLDYAYTDEGFLYWNFGTKGYLGIMMKTENLLILNLLLKILMA